MSIWIWVLIIFVVIVAGAYLFYDLYWLGQPQVFLVYQPKGQFTKFDKNVIDSVEKVTGAKIASQKEMENEVKEGLNICTNGMLLAGDGSKKDNYILGWPTYVDKNFNGSSDGKSTCADSCDKVAGCVAGCGCNKMFNQASWGTPVKGVWVYGSKPAKLPSEWKKQGWEISNFSNARQGLGKTIVNKYELFGIPKLF